MQSELGPIRERRRMWESRPADVFDILKAGSEKARATAARTLEDVRHAMQIDYFSEENLRQLTSQE